MPAGTSRSACSSTVRQKTDDQVIIGRETFWKEALLSRRAYGDNLN
jgi:hypothetical protein